jgi:hypothetical protein
VVRGRPGRNTGRAPLIAQNPANCPGAAVDRWSDSLARARGRNQHFRQCVGLPARIAPQRAAARRAEGVASARAPKGGRPRNEEKVAMSHLSKGSTHADRIVARLKRDHPAIAHPNGSP